MYGNKRLLLCLLAVILIGGCRMNTIDRIFSLQDTAQMGDSVAITPLSPSDFIFLATTNGIEMRRKSDLAPVRRVTRFVDRNGYDYGPVENVASLAIDHNFCWVSHVTSDGVPRIMRLRWAGLTVRDQWVMPSSEPTVAPKIATDRVRIIRAYGYPENYGLFLHSKLAPFKLLTHDSGFQTSATYPNYDIHLGQGECDALRGVDVELRPSPDLIPVLESTGVTASNVALTLDNEIVYVLLQTMPGTIAIVWALSRGVLNVLDATQMTYAEVGGHVLSPLDLTVDDVYLYVIGTASGDPVLVKALAFNVGDASYVDASYSGEFGDYVDHVVLDEAAVAVACIPPMYDTEFVNEAQGGSAEVRMAFPKPAPERKTRHPARSAAYLSLRLVARMVGAIVNIAKPRTTLSMWVESTGHKYFTGSAVGQLVMSVMARAIRRGEAVTTLMMSVVARPLLRLQFAVVTLGIRVDAHSTVFWRHAAASLLMSVDAQSTVAWKKVIATLLMTVEASRVDDSV